MLFTLNCSKNMLKIIFGTITTRVISAVLSFLIIILNSRLLGAEGQGTISLVVLGITINSLISSFVGGSSLVYLIPRYNLFKLMFLSYNWAVISSFLGTLILFLFNLIPEQLYLDVFIISLVLQLANVNTSSLLGKKKVVLYNISAVIQIISIFTILNVYLFILHKVEVSSYITALKLGSLIYFSLSLFFVIKLLTEISFKNLNEVLVQMLKYGSFIQFANILQLMNYRLSYYIIEFYYGRSSLGQYSVGIQFSESLWLVSRSLAMIQYSEISNSNDNDFNKKITLQFIKLSFLVTNFGLFCLLLIPESVFIFILEKDFSNIKMIISSLGLGILSMSVSVMFSHYLSGIGKHFYNTIGSGIGFVITVILGFLLIPKFGILGAGITASISYLISAIYLLIIFIRMSNSNITDFLITKSDFNYIINKIKTKISSIK